MQEDSAHHEGTTMPHDTIHLLASSLFVSLVGLSPIALSPGEIKAASTAFENRQYSRALAQLRIAADKGNSRAQCISGLMLLYGEKLYGAEIRTDRAAAVRYLEKAAAQGDATAKFMLRRVAQTRAPRSASMPAQAMKRE